jgi:hypothetical protein
LMAFVNSSGAIQYFVSSTPQSIPAAFSSEQQQQHQQQQHRQQPPPQPQQHQQRIISQQYQMPPQQPQFQSSAQLQYPVQSQQVAYQSPMRAHTADIGFDSSLDHVQQSFGSMQLHDTGSTSAVNGTAIMASNASREQHLLAMQLQLQERDRLKLLNRRSNSASANGVGRNHSGRISTSAGAADAGSHRSAASHAAPHRPSS